MPQLPNQTSFSTAAGSQWQQTFTMTDGTGTPINLTGLTWQFVIRPTVQDTTAPPLVSVTTTPTGQGSITVTPLTGTVTVSLTPAATALLGKGQRPYTLWSNPGTATAIAWAAGNFTSQLVATA